jgi:hypothetical protein
VPPRNGLVLSALAIAVAAALVVVILVSEL